MKKAIWFVGFVGFGGALLAGQGCGSAVEFPGSLTGGPAATDGGPGPGATCANGNSCTAPSGCVNGTCGPCTKDIQCPTGLICKNSQCVADTVAPADSGSDSGGGCKVDADCTGGKICKAPICVPCASSSECPNGQTCLNGACFCTTDVQCPSGQKCIANVCTVVTTTPDSGVIVPDSGVDSGTCAGKPIYFGIVTAKPSVWTYMAFTPGTTSGTEMCKAIGADRFCDYEDLKSASARGELAGIGNGTTFWLHRTTPGPLAQTAGGNARCENWTYSTNHLSQGEFGTVNAGVANFDIAASGSPGPPGGSARTCGGTNRAILCCYPKCP